MEGHTNNVSFAVFHPSLPLIVSGSEDGTIKIWNSGTYRLENTLSYALERAWCIAIRPQGNEVAVGYDEGVVMVKLGRDEPSFSMDPSGKLVYTCKTEVLTANLQGAADDETPEGRIPLSVRELGTTEIYATSLQHSPNGRFITVVGDGEYIIYTVLAWRNKVFGNGSSLAWTTDSNMYAVLEGQTTMQRWSLVLRGDMEAAEEMLPTVPKDQQSRVAHSSKPWVHHIYCSPELRHGDSGSRGRSNDHLTKRRRGDSGSRGRAHTRREPVLSPPVLIDNV